MHVFLCLLYVYFVILTFTFFAFQVLDFPPLNVDCRVDYSTQQDPIFNVDLHNLLRIFNVSITVFIIRRAVQNYKYRRIVYSKLELGFSSSYNNPKHHSRLTRIMISLCHWALLMNFLSIAIVNPGMKNPGPQIQEKFSVFYSNVQGLVPFGDLGATNPMLNVTKIHELNQMVHEKKPDIIIYNETWLKSSILDNEVLPTDKYKIFRLDRSTFTHPPDPDDCTRFRRNGGGVLIGIKHNLEVESKVIPVKCRAEILCRTY